MNIQTYIDSCRARGITVAEQTVAPAAFFFHPGPEVDCSEKELDAAIVKLANRYGWLTHHQTISKRSAAGWPDRVFIRDGKLLIRELKREGEQPTPAQLVWLAALQSCGLDVGVWRASDWAEIVEALT